MFDELRERSASPFDDEDDSALDFDDDFNEMSRAARGPERTIMGLTAVQRFVLSMMLFLNVFMLGCFCLLATGRIVPVQ